LHKREKLNKLIILELSQSTLKANALYNHIRNKDPTILREEHVKSFRSFVKVINSFGEVEALGNRVKVYALRK